MLPSVIMNSRRLMWMVTVTLPRGSCPFAGRNDTRFSKGRIMFLLCDSPRARMSLVGLGRAKTFGSAEFWGFEGCRFWDWLCPDRSRQRPDTYDAHHPRHIVGQHVQCHL